MTDRWQCIEIPVGSRSAEIWLNIQESFEAIFIAHGGPESASMHYASNPETITLYLSPGAAAIFDGAKWGARPCSKPSSAGLLVGHASAFIGRPRAS